MNKVTKISMYEEEQIAEILPSLQTPYLHLELISTSTALCEVTTGHAHASTHPICLPLPRHPTTHTEIHYLLSSLPGFLM